MATTTAKSTPNTSQSTVSHKRWYPQIPSEASVDFHNANRFTWDALYQLRDWTRQLAQASGVGLIGDSTAAASGKSGAVGSKSSGLSLSQNATGPSNSQILGLNVSATPPQDGQSLAYNAATGQIEFTSPTANVVVWTTTLPTSHTSAGVKGTIAFDPTGSDTHLYVCAKTGPSGSALWGRVGLDYSF